MKKTVITIARSYGSGGKTLGNLLAKDLGINCYSREILRMASDESGINEALFGEVDEKMKKSPLLLNILKKNPYKGGVLPPVLKDNPDVIRLFFYAPLEDCIRRVVDQNGISAKEAEKKIAKIDKYRADYYKYYTGNAWNDARNYDFCLDTSSMSYEKLIAVVKDIIKIYQE